MKASQWTDLRFLVEKFRGQKEGGQLDRSQRNLDLGLDLTFLKIGIQHPSIIVRLPGIFDIKRFRICLLVLEKRQK